MHMYVFQVALYNTDQEGSDSPRSSLNNSLSDQSLASVNLNSVGSVHSYTPVRNEQKWIFSQTKPHGEKNIFEDFIWSIAL